MTERLLLTGGLGYIGGRLVEHLKSAGGFELRLASRRAPEARPAWAAGLDVVRSNPLEIVDLDRLCHGITAVIHLAGANELLSAEDPGAALRDTALSTLMLLEAAERQGVGRFVYFSTAHVYGAPLVGRIDEASLPRPLHPYAITHRAAEDFVLAATARRALAGLVLRVSNGIGAPADASIDRWTLVGNDLCRQAVTGRRLVLRSSGLQRRDCLGLGEIARAVEHFLRRPETWTDGLFNLGSGRSRSILKIAELVAERSRAVLGHSTPIERPPATAGEAAADLDFRIDKLKRSGFAPNPDLEAEIDRTLLLCRDHAATVNR